MPETYKDKLLAASLALKQAGAESAGWEEAATIRHKNTVATYKTVISQFYYVKDKVLKDYKGDDPLPIVPTNVVHKAAPGNNDKMLSAVLNIVEWMTSTILVTTEEVNSFADLAEIVDNQAQATCAGLNNHEEETLMSKYFNSRDEDEDSDSDSDDENEEEDDQGEGKGDADPLPLEEPAWNMDSWEAKPLSPRDSVLEQ